MKLSARVIVAAAAVLTFLASCGQLIGDFEVVRLPNQAPPEGPPPPICTLGATQCEGRLLQLCVEEGTAWTTLEPCATAELCQSSDVSTVSACIKPTCGEEQMSCEGAELRLCNASRTGWEPFATCESAAHCDAGNRQCLAAPCEPGARRCNVGNLERCNDASTAWEPLDTCVTNDLCEQTLAPPAVVGEILTTGQVPAPPPSNAEGPISCRQPECVPREVRCEFSRLNACNEGQTDLELAEECATPKLCDASITYTGLRGSPRCVRPVCAAGEHRCSPEGVLELCNIDRDGYDPIEACIGAPFCNAVAADNGLPGCEDAPCDPGEEQCNGPQIQRCLDDQTAFVAVGAACETRGLCNDDNSPAFCAQAVCQRGPFSGSEFRCEGATLQRCNDQHTGYDTLSSCATPGLCNAGLGFNGCQTPACAAGETRCSGNFVQVCNEQRTAFINVEQCAQGTCDSAAGRCADPCIEGSGRCNAQGNLEECRNRLTGWEITARCGSVQLCDPGARTCRAPPAGCTADGVRRCRAQGAGSVLEVCSDGRSRFATLDTCVAGEFCDANDVTCDACIAGSEPTCSGNDLVSCSADGKTDIVQPCANGCQTVASGPDRCRTCVPGSVSCSGEQLVVCRQRGSEEFLDREDCASAALCQNTVAACNANGDGQSCRCAPGVCSPGDRDCNGSQPVQCNADQTALVANGPNCGIEENCNGAPIGACFVCGAGDIQCNAAGVMQGCLPDRSGFANLPNAPFPGELRCVRDNGGERAQSCNGSQLVDDDCESGICLDGVGCAECDPRAPFTSTCASPTSRTACNPPGVIGTVDCDSDVACTTGICTGGQCLTSDLDEGSQCQLPGGGTGRCDGDPKCVQCINDEDCPNDAVDCTVRSCNDSGVCVQVPDNSRCGGNFCAPSTCSATGCVSGTAPTCADTNVCTDDGPCDPVAGACTFPPNDDPCTLANGDPGECRDRVCFDTGCSSDDECDNRDACDGVERCNTTSGECVGGTAPRCNDEEACNGVESCDRVLGCQPGLAVDCEDFNGCTVDSCAGGICAHDGCSNGTQCIDGACIDPGCTLNPDACVDTNLCDGTETCNPVTRQCAEGTPVQCGPGLQCVDGDCIDPNPPPPPLPGCLGNPQLCADDGDNCNGVFVCNSTGGCDQVTPPCNGNQVCNNNACEAVVTQPPVDPPVEEIPTNTGGNNGGGSQGGQPAPPAEQPQQPPAEQPQQPPAEQPQQPPAEQPQQPPAEQPQQPPAEQPQQPPAEQPQQPPAEQPQQPPAEQPQQPPAEQPQQPPAEQPQQPPVESSEQPSQSTDGQNDDIADSEGESPENAG